MDAENLKKDYVYVKCKFCNKVITGGVTRLKEHHGQTHKNVAPCLKVPKEVKEEIIAYLKNFEREKHVKQKFFYERVESSSYFGALIEDMHSYPMEWLDHFGDQVMELRFFAMRVLGLTCSSSAYEWSLQLIDEGENDFGDEDNEIGFDDVDGFEDRLNNYEYDLPNDPNPYSVDENNE
ncbi:hypothetical protein LWI28_000718 [Acer negundo]|uniref:Uncharacterized protein n=1 Tax=Acer negundo TaxID=4023 RepID=A0AAD5P0P3_ACENE|nr:hypothetical protein LWI28_000718 [Acer negundo]